MIVTGTKIAMKESTFFTAGKNLKSCKTIANASQPPSGFTRDSCGTSKNAMITGTTPKEIRRKRYGESIAHIAQLLLFFTLLRFAIVSELLIEIFRKTNEMKHGCTGHFMATSAPHSLLLIS
jgi:hypothetical protein